MRRLALLLFDLLIVLFFAGWAVFSADAAPGETSLSDMNLPFLEQKREAISWGRDPFFLPIESEPVKEVEQKRDQPFLLNAIIYKEGQGAAIINDRIVRMGDYIEGMLVQEVQPDRVVLKEGGKVIELKVNQLMFK